MYKTPVKAEAWKTFLISFWGWVAPADRCKLVRVEERGKNNEDDYVVSSNHQFFCYFHNQLVGGFNFFDFQPELLGEIIEIDQHFFQMGWNWTTQTHKNISLGLLHLSVKLTTWEIYFLFVSLHIWWFWCVFAAKSRKRGRCVSVVYSPLEGDPKSSPPQCHHLRENRALTAGLMRGWCWLIIP